MQRFADARLGRAKNGEDARQSDAMRYGAKYRCWRLNAKAINECSSVVWSGQVESSRVVSLQSDVEEKNGGWVG